MSSQNLAIEDLAENGNEPGNYIIISDFHITQYCRKYSNDSIMIIMVKKVENLSTNKYEFH